jgi:hypothetical protein
MRDRRILHAETGKVGNCHICVRAHRNAPTRDDLGEADRQRPQRTKLHPLQLAQPLALRDVIARERRKPSKKFRRLLKSWPWVAALIMLLGSS